MEKSAIEITLELERVEGPPTGRARSGDRAQDFSGWLGLMSAIDSLVIESGRASQAAEADRS